MFVAFALITIQAILGGIDNLWHHEITERLPARRAAAGELSLHALREFLYAFLFLGLAWFQWLGHWAYLIAAVLACEIVVTLADFLVEDKTRRLPAWWVSRQSRTVRGGWCTGSVSRELQRPGCVVAPSGQQCSA